MTPTVLLMICTVVTQTNGNLVPDCQAMPLTFYTERDCIVMRDRYRASRNPDGGGRLKIVYECLRPKGNYEVVR